jgi:ferredoxin
MLKVIVDRDRCVGAGLCADALPEVFDQGEDSVVVLLDEVPSKVHAKALADVEFTCPSGAIRILR